MMLKIKLIKSGLITAVFIFLISNISIFAQETVSSDNFSNVEPRPAKDFLGIRLRPEIKAIISEIEKKSGKTIYAEFTDLRDFQFGVSYISEDGSPVVLIDEDLRNDPQKLEAVAAHELLHLRLRVNHFPTFLFSPTVTTAKGRAVDVEQSNVNDLLSLIEHRAFKPEMERLGLQKYINLAGDTANSVKGGKAGADGQADSLNYARAVLEYPNQKDVEEVALIYRENKWTRALTSGTIIADFISRANLQTPAQIEAVFLKCLLELYQPPSTHTFKFTLDPENKFFRRMLINTARKPFMKTRR